MRDHDTNDPVASAPDAQQTSADWARAVIMSAMFGIVLLATLPNLIGLVPTSRNAELQLPPLLGFVRGI